MLAEMHQYLRPEWDVFPEQKMPMTHAHEALRRLLFKEIVRMKESGDKVPPADERDMPMHVDVQKEIDKRNVMMRLSHRASVFDSRCYLATQVEAGEAGEGARGGIHVDIEGQGKWKEQADGEMSV